MLNASHSERSIRPLDALGSILLVAAISICIALAWRSPAAEGYYAMHRAEGLLREGRYSQAQALLEQTLPSYNSPAVRLDLSYAYLARRDAERAERQARIAQHEAPPHQQAAVMAQLGRVLAFEGRNDEALSAWSAARKATASYPDVESSHDAARSSLWHIAMTHWSHANWAAARRDLDELSADNDLYASSARVKLAQLDAPSRQVSLEVPSNAAQPAMFDLRLPGPGEGLTQQVMSATITDLQLAEAEVAKAVEGGADQASINTIWGGSYLQQGEDLLAREYLQRALSANPDYEPAHARLALALLNLGESDASLQHLETAVRLDPADPLPHHLLARLYTQSSLWSKAEAELKTLDRLERNSVEVHIQWAEYYRLLGEYDQAEGEYIDAANLQVSGASSPGGINAPLTLAHFYTDVRGFGCEKGLPAAKQSLALKPDDPASFDAVGWSLVLCHTADALPALEAAVREAPDVPRYRLHLAKAYSQVGRIADAREQYGWVLDLDPGGPLERLALNDLVLLQR